MKRFSGDEIEKYGGFAGWEGLVISFCCENKKNDVFIV